MRINRKLVRSQQVARNGFSALEVLLVMAVSLIIAAFAIPGFNQARRALRISGDARDLNGAINHAKLQAAADFTRARVFIDINANKPNTFHVDVWNKAGNGGNGCWQTIGDVNNPCMARFGNSPVQNLSPNVTFGFAGVGAPPPNTQGAGIQQAPLCYRTRGNGLGQIPGTACIEFNSRGMPVDQNGVPIGNDAFYITDNTVVFGVTVGATGLSQVWATSANGQANWYRK